MYCLKCGTQLPSDSQFCTNCGARVDGDSVPSVESIAPPPVGQPNGYGQQPPHQKKSKALLWILIGAAAALTVAAVLFFVVFASGSGNTVQMRFANDAAGVLTGAFSGFESENDISKVKSEPFELTLNYSSDMAGVKSDMAIEAAYDKEALGISMTSSSDLSSSQFAEFLDDTDVMENTMKILLDGDVLYIAQNGTTYGLRFNPDTDLSKPMPLSERIAATLNNKDINSINHMKVIEMFINSIDEKNFVKDENQTTLTLDGDSLANSLDEFAHKLEDDTELNDALSEMFQGSDGEAFDLSSTISEAAPTLRQSDFKLVWTIYNDNGKPLSMDIAYEESGSTVVNASFGYEIEEEGKSINFDVADDKGQVLALDLLLNKTEKGIEFEGIMDISNMGQLDIDGYSEIMDNSLSGSINITTLGMTATIDYEETVSIGMPKVAVEDDSRFEVDTEGAMITDLDEIISSENGSLQMLPLYFWINLFIS